MRTTLLSLKGIARLLTGLMIFSSTFVGYGTYPVQADEVEDQRVPLFNSDNDEISTIVTNSLGSAGSYASDFVLVDIGLLEDANLNRSIQVTLSTKSAEHDFSFSSGGIPSPQIVPGRIADGFMQMAVPEEISIDYENIAILGGGAFPGETPVEFHAMPKDLSSGWKIIAQLGGLLTDALFSPATMLKDILKFREMTRCLEGIDLPTSNTPFDDTNENDVISIPWGVTNPFDYGVAELRITIPINSSLSVLELENLLASKPLTIHIRQKINVVQYNQGMSDYVNPYFLEFVSTDIGGFWSGPAFSGSASISDDEYILMKIAPGDNIYPTTPMQGDGVELFVDRDAPPSWPENWLWDPGLTGMEIQMSVMPYNTSGGNSAFKIVITPWWNSGIDHYVDGSEAVKPKLSGGVFSLAIPEYLSVDLNGPDTYQIIDGTSHQIFLGPDDCGGSELIQDKLKDIVKEVVKGIGAEIPGIKFIVQIPEALMILTENDSSEGPDLSDGTRLGLSSENEYDRIFVSWDKEIESGAALEIVIPMQSSIEDVINAVASDKVAFRIQSEYDYNELRCVNINQDCSPINYIQQPIDVIGKEISIPPQPDKLPEVYSPPTTIQPATIGDIDTNFVFSIGYSDEDNESPDDAVVVIDSSSYLLSSTNNNYKDGVIYSSAGKSFTVGTHNYFFEITQKGVLYRYPATGYLTFQVSPRSDIINLNASLSPELVTVGEPLLISGKVLENNNPISAQINVEIIETGISNSSQADTLGNFQVGVSAPQSPGNYSVKITAATSNAANSTIQPLAVVSQPLANSQLAISNFEASDHVEPGNPIKVSAVVHNTGKVSMQYKLRYEVRNPAGLLVSFYDYPINTLLPTQGTTNLTQSLATSLTTGTYTVKARLLDQYGNPLSDWILDDNQTTQEVLVSPTTDYQHYQFYNGSTEIPHSSTPNSTTVSGILPSTFRVEVTYRNDSSTSAQMWLYKGTTPVFQQIWLDEGNIYYYQNKSIMFRIYNVDGNWVYWVLGEATDDSNFDLGPTNPLKIKAGSKGAIIIEADERITSPIVNNEFGSDFEQVLSSWSPKANALNSNKTMYEMEFSIPINETQRTFEFFLQTDHYYDPDEMYLEKVYVEVMTPDNVGVSALSPANNSPFWIGDIVPVDATIINHTNYLYSEVPLMFEVTGPNDYSYSEGSVVTSFNGYASKTANFSWRTGGLSSGTYTVKVSTDLASDSITNDDSLVRTIVLNQKPTINVVASVDKSTIEEKLPMKLSAVVSNSSNGSLISDALVYAHITGPSLDETQVMNYNINTGNYEIELAYSNRGDYQYTINATKDGFLQGQTTSAGHFTVINAAPDTWFTLSSIIEGERISQTNVTFDWGGKDTTTPENSLYYSHKLNSASWSAPSMGTSIELTDLDEGANSFYVRAYDGIDADPSPAVLSFYVDTTSPTFDTLPTQNLDLVTAGSMLVITVDASEPVEPRMNLYSVDSEFLINDVDIKEVNTDDNVYELTYTFSDNNLRPDGTYYIQIVLRDRAGNSSTKVDLPIVLENRSPSVIDYQPVNAINVPRNTVIEVTFSEAMNKSSVENAFSILPNVDGSFNWNANTLVFTPDSLLESGTEYTIRVADAALDIAGKSLNPFDFSFNTASGPIIVHTPVSNVQENSPLTITANITSWGTLQNVDLHYRVSGTSTYTVLEMINTSGDEYQASIPVIFVTSDGLEYYISAVDDNGTTNHPSSGFHSVVVTPSCYILTLSHTGSGGDPVATPPNSPDCPVGQYLAGSSISLLASPTVGYEVGSWNGTDNNASTAITNTTSMPVGPHPVAVNYILITPPTFSKISPANTSSELSPTSVTLIWESSTAATSYEYCYDITNDNTCDGGWVNTGINNQVTLSGLSYSTTYYWQVRAINAGGTVNANGSTWWSFATAVNSPEAFNKLSPSDAQSGLSLSTTLSWSSSAGATGYEYCIDTTNDSICEGGWIVAGSQLSVIISGLEYSTVYRWQVRAVNAGGPVEANSGAWWTFSTENEPTPPGQFNKVSPTNGATGQPTNLTISWGTSAGADGYEYCYDTSNDNACGGSWTNVGVYTSANLNGLSAGTTYYWQARAINTDGTTYANGNSIAYWSFTTEMENSKKLLGFLPLLCVNYAPLTPANRPPEIPYNPTPENNTNSQEVEVNLSWMGGDPDGDAITYDVYFQAETNPPTTLVSNDKSSTSFDPGPLQTDTQYFWMIIAQDEHGSITEGPVWSFTTNGIENGPPYTPSNPSPPDGSTNQSINLDLSWIGGDPDGDSVTYSIYFVPDSGEYEALCSFTSETTCDPGTLEYNTTYKWKVYAVDSLWNTSVSPEWTFTTAGNGNLPPNTPSNLSPANNDADQSLDVDLNWTGGDPDGDGVTYDVYLEADDSTPDVMVAGNLKGLNFTPGTLVYGTHYYWQIVATDEVGASTPGPVWNFTTVDEVPCDINLSLYFPQVSGQTVTISGTVSSNCSAITRLNWAWGDGVTDDQWFPASHNYITSGTYPITATAYNDLGSTQVETTTATVINYTSDMVYVPAGEFQMGCDPAFNGGYSCAGDELPLHTVYLDAFLIDKYEVTNNQYAQCVDAGVCTPPNTGMYGNPTYIDYPVIMISWSAAADFCTWTGRRLPTEAEWEKAARGAIDTRAFPWGDQAPNCNLANYYDYTGVGSGYYCEGSVTQVGSYPLGASPYGVQDMAGNAWEWVSDWYSSSYYTSASYNNPTGPDNGTEKILRGGDTWTTGIELRVASREHSSPVFPGDYSKAYGFRCADSEPQLNNKPPSIPNAPNPEDNLSDQSITSILSWSGGDPDNDTVTYDVYFEAYDNTPDVLTANDQASLSYTPGTLAYSNNYYWQVIATDEHGASTLGPLLNFTTENRDPSNIWEEVGAGSTSSGVISNKVSGSVFPNIAIAPDAKPYITWQDGWLDGVVVPEEIYVRRWNGTLDGNTQSTMP